MHRFTVCCGIILMAALGVLAGDVSDAQRRIFDAQTVQPCDSENLPPRDTFVTDAYSNGDFEAGLDTWSGAYGHEDGYHIRTIQELLGHADVQTTMIYTHVLNNAGGRRVRSLPGNPLTGWPQGLPNPSAYPNRTRLIANPANTAASVTRPNTESQRISGKMKARM